MYQLILHSLLLPLTLGCDGSKLSTDYTSYTPVVAIGQNVSITACHNSSYDYVLGPETNVTCLATRRFSESIPQGYQCYAKPDVYVVIIGISRVNITATEDTSNTQRGMVLEKVVIQRVMKSQAIAEIIFNSGDLMKIMSGWEYYDSALEFGSKGYFTIAFHYAGFTKPLSGQDDFQMAPQALNVSKYIISYTGATLVKISLSTDQWSSNIAELVTEYPDLTFTIELISEINRETLWISTDNSATLHTKEVGDVIYMVYTVSVPEGTLTDVSVCRVKISSVSKGLKGGALVLNSVVGGTTRGSTGSLGVSLAVAWICLANVLFL